MFVCVGEWVNVSVSVSVSAGTLMCVCVRVLTPDLIHQDPL